MATLPITSSTKLANQIRAASVAASQAPGTSIPKVTATPGATPVTPMTSSTQATPTVSTAASTPSTSTTPTSGTSASTGSGPYSYARPNPNTDVPPITGNPPTTAGTGGSILYPGLPNPHDPNSPPGLPNPNTNPPGTNNTPATTNPPADTNPPTTTDSTPNPPPTSSTPSTSTTPTVDYAAQMKAALEAQQAALAAMYTQQAQAQAEQIRQAIAAQIAQSEATKADYTNQMNAAITSLNTERGNLPGQVTAENNQASANGAMSAQHIRSALAQMGLLQSGESASQQLANDATVGNNINANNLQGQQIDAQYANQIAAYQADLVSKTKAINDAIAQAQANGDTNALAALQQAQAQIALSAAQNNTTLNQYQYQIWQDAIKNSQAQQQINNQASQFAQQLGLSQQQLAAQISQWGASNALEAQGLQQQASQFAQQLGLTRQQFLAQMQQWAATYNAGLAQQGFQNGITLGELTGSYAGDVDPGTPRVTVNPDGSIGTVPVTTTDPSTTTGTILDISGNPVVQGTTTTGPTGITWNNYPLVGSKDDAPPTNSSGATLTGYRLVATTAGKSYYMPIYSDQLPAGSVPTGAKIAGKKNGLPIFKGV
jgi:HRD ubiquitin ligase complex, ER membrane component